MTKEIFHNGVVVAITPAGHALKDPVLLQLISIGVHLVCPAAIRVKGEPVLAVTGCVDGFTESCHYAMIAVVYSSLSFLYHNICNCGSTYE